MVPPSSVSGSDTEALGENILAELTLLARRLAEAAGEAALPHFRSAALIAENKATGAFDPVTAADRSAEAAVRAILAAERPRDGILGEEDIARASESGLTWIIDPIDGTRSFISGVPTWGVLIALDDGSTGRIGIVAQPYIGELFIGVKGPRAARAWFERGETRRNLRTRPCAGLEAASLFTTSPQMFAAGEWEGFQKVAARAQLTRYGTDCYGYALLAHGLIDLVIESDLAAYDIAAPKVLVEAAGGVVTDWHGGDCRQGGQVIAAGDRAVHAEALALLAPYAL